MEVSDVSSFILAIRNLRVKRVARLWQVYEHRGMHFISHPHLLQLYPYCPLFLGSTSPLTHLVRARPSRLSTLMGFARRLLPTLLQARPENVTALSTLVDCCTLAWPSESASRSPFSTPSYQATAW